MEAVIPSPDLQSLLPPNLEQEALNQAVLQEALDVLQAFQLQARAALFDILQKQANSSIEELNAGLDALISSAAYLLPDTPEATLAQYAQHYRQLCHQVSQLKSQEEQTRVEADMAAVREELTQCIQEGRLVDAASVVRRIAWMLSEHEASKPDAVQQDDQQDGEETSTDRGQQDGSEAQASAWEARRQVLEQQHAECKERLQQVLLAASALLVRVEPSVPHEQQQQPQQPGVLYVCNQLPAGAVAEAGPLSSSEVWAALSDSGQLQQALGRVAEEVVGQVMRPALAGGGRYRPQLQTSPAEPSTPATAAAAGPAGVTTLSWEEVEQGGGTPPDAICRQVVQVVAEVGLGLESSLTRALGDVLWRPLCDTYVAVTLRPAAAAALSAGGDSGAALCGELVEGARGLEDWAESLGIVEGPYLGPAAEQAVQRLVDAQQQQPLVAARAALLLDSPTAGEGRSSAGGQQQQQLVRVGQPLALDERLYQRFLSGSLPEWEAENPPCGVAVPVTGASSSSSSSSMNGHAPGGFTVQGWGGSYLVGPGMAQVSQLVQSTLQEAAASGSPACGRALVGAVRGITLMARSLPTSLPADAAALSSVPQLALLHHNGLRHLSDTLLAALTVHGSTLDELLGEPHGLMSQALLLRQAAAAVLHQQVTSQSNVLRELLGGLQGLSRLGGSGAGQAGITARKVINQVLHSLGRLGRVLVDTLAPEPLVQVCSQVLGSVCSAVVSDVMAKRDIGIDDSRELRLILGPLVSEALTSLLPAGQGSSPAAGNVSGVPAPVLQAVVLGRCAPLRKLKSLLGLLEASMKDIVSGWESRELKVAGFDADEVEHLLCALFEASDYRRDAIARVRASAW